jgi:DNA polymerase-3 subunit delta'
VRLSNPHSKNYARLFATKTAPATALDPFRWIAIDPSHYGRHVATPLLDSIRSQDAAVATLRRAIANNRVHHAYLFEGADGVGKELAAFGLAQALECERRRDGEAEACGACSSCERVVPKAGISRHPDVIAIERGLYDPAQIGRRTPETQDISIDQVRTLVLARAAFPPHEGKAKVFIVRRAEELSISAANALLKTLEEPNARTHFVLLTTQPDALLQTIRSRTLRLRFASLSDQAVAEILAAHGETENVDRIVALAEGSAARAVSLTNPEERAEREAFVEKATRAIASNDALLGLELAEESKKDKEQLELGLVELARYFAQEAKNLATKNDRGASRAAAQFQATMTAIDDLGRNGAAQLVVESMILKLRSA